MTISKLGPGSDGHKGSTVQPQTSTMGPASAMTDRAHQPGPGYPKATCSKPKGK